MPTDSFWVFRVAVGSHQKEIGINFLCFYIILYYDLKNFVGSDYIKKLIYLYVVGFIIGYFLLLIINNFSSSDIGRVELFFLLLFVLGTSFLFQYLRRRNETEE